MSNLVIVESPAKAKTIKKYLGKDYKMDLTDKDYSLVVCNHIGFYVTFFYNTFYRKLY